MPDGLLSSFKEDEILDLLAYLLSRGHRNHKIFQKQTQYQTAGLLADAGCDARITLDTPSSILET
jgi:hypothetical protein